ncbi:MAG: hypothetical protein ACOC70_02720 [bacterium]
MADTYSVLARDPTSVAAAQAARAIAKVTGEVAFDLTRKLRDRAGGVLVSGLEKARADRVVGALSQAGVGAFALADADRVEFPGHVYLETARLGDEDLIVSDLRDANYKPTGSARVPYDDIVLLVCAAVRFTHEKRVVDPSAERRLPGSHPWGPTGMFGDTLRSRRRYLQADDYVPVKRTETRHEDRHLLDLFAVEPAHHLRLDATRFNFIQTGLTMQPTSVLNLIEVIKRLAPRCSRAFADPSIHHILDGNPLSNLRFTSPDQYDAYLDWRVQVLYHPQDE